MHFEPSEQSLTTHPTAFMIATSVLAPVASGLLTTLDLDGSKVEVVALLGFLDSVSELATLALYRP